MKTLTRFGEKQEKEE